LIADAPCHGSKYHKTVLSDTHASGDPNGRVLEDQIAEFASRGIVLTSIKITELTDKMFEIMNQVY